MRTGGGLAIVIGAFVGVALAFARQRGSSPPTGPLPAPRAAHSAAPLAPPAEPAASTEPLPLVELTPTLELPPAVPPPPPTAASASVPPVALAPTSTFPMPVPAPPPTTAKELERAEVRCYDKRPDECERAASAYEAGLFGATDRERAERLRKVALTFLVRGCEKRSPHACYVLGSRYQSGVGVQPSERKALALLEHARKLCRSKPGPECVAGEPR
jgi:localization factor PodJL